MKKELINTVLDLYEQLTYHIENEEHSEEKLLRKELNERKTLAKIPLSLTECHMIACIGGNDDEMVNGTFIAKNLNITKGGVSKAASKLINKKMIETVKSESNRKEIYYVLTAIGRDAYLAHEQMHEKAHQQHQQILNEYTNEELAAVKKFLKDFMFTHED